MHKDIMIKLQGSQNVASQNSETIELTTCGTIEYVENGCKITYEETELTGMQGTTTSIIVEKTGKITLNRTGTTNSCLVFEEGKKNLSYYDTDVGAFSISVYANYLEADINEDGGSIEIDYVLEVNGNFAGQNEISITFDYLDSK